MLTRADILAICQERQIPMTRTRIDTARAHGVMPDAIQSRSGQWLYSQADVDRLLDLTAEMQARSNRRINYGQLAIA